MVIQKSDISQDNSRWCLESCLMPTTSQAKEPMSMTSTPAMLLLCTTKQPLYTYPVYSWMSSFTFWLVFISK